MPDLKKSGSWIGMSAIATSMFLYGYVAIASPGWLHTAVMPLVWLVIFVLGCAWFLRHPYAVLTLGGGAIAAWFAFVLAA